MSNIQGVLNHCVLGFSSQLRFFFLSDHSGAILDDERESARVRLRFPRRRRRRTTPSRSVTSRVIPFIAVFLFTFSSAYAIVLFLSFADVTPWLSLLSPWAVRSVETVLDGRVIRPYVVWMAAPQYAFVG